MDVIANLFAGIPPDYKWPAEFCTATTVVVWVLSLITANVSQVDRLWTFLPTIYTAYYALLPLLPHEPLFFLCPYAPKALHATMTNDFSPRALMMFGVVFIWMCRLSYNTYRRGLFRLGDEDYRWAVLRANVPGWLFQVINLTFIAAIQNILLLLLGLPTRIAATQPHTPLAPSDIALGALALVVLAFEFTSDNQQWAFHAYKHAYLAKEAGKSNVQPYDKNQQWPGARLNFVPEDAKRGFITRGLWAYSRHPNFFCEQSFWWIITLIPLLSPSPPHLVYTASFPDLSGLLQNPAEIIPLLAPLKDAVPALALSALFFSSTLFTESISYGKYPREYGAYQKRVGMFSPVGTLEKGLFLALRGKKHAIDAIVWGKGKKD